MLNYEIIMINQKNLKTFKLHAKLLRENAEG